MAPTTSRYKAGLWALVVPWPIPTCTWGGGSTTFFPVRPLPATPAMYWCGLGISMIYLFYGPALDNFVDLLNNNTYNLKFTVNSDPHKIWCLDLHFTIRRLLGTQSCLPPVPTLPHSYAAFPMPNTSDLEEIVPVTAISNTIQIYWGGNSYCVVIRSRSYVRHLTRHFRNLEMLFPYVTNSLRVIILHGQGIQEKGIHRCGHCTFCLWVSTGSRFKLPNGELFLSAFSGWLQYSGGCVPHDMEMQCFLRW